MNKLTKSNICFYDIFISKTQDWTSTSAIQKKTSTSTTANNSYPGCHLLINIKIKIVVAYKPFAQKLSVSLTMLRATYLFIFKIIFIMIIQYFYMCLWQSKRKIVDTFSITVTNNDITPKH